MRLWHYKLIPFLPDKQLIAQWRELNSIFKKQDDHILINYVYQCPKADLKKYTQLVMMEMHKRKIKIRSWRNYDLFISNCYEVSLKEVTEPFAQYHTNRYMRQCFYNLQEKYDRGQKDFSEEQYKLLEDFVKKEVGLWFVNM